LEPHAVTQQTLLPELHERDATGRIAEIYDEIRRFSGVPYVSSLQRYLATLPGVLEWAWDAVRPAMVSGEIPQTGWRLAEDVRIAPAAPVFQGTLRDWGAGAADLAAMRNVAENFVRVSPVNIMTGACLRAILTGTVPAGREQPINGWVPPTMLAAMPGNVEIAALSPFQRRLIMRLATEVDGQPFIPALYRQYAHWPGMLAWLADVLEPRLDAAETNTARARFRAAAIEAGVPIAERLPALRGDFRPDAETTRRVLATIDRYAQTSPEMTMFGRLILDALPERWEGPA
jgi:hypothetical protein